MISFTMSDSEISDKMKEIPRELIERVYDDFFDKAQKLFDEKPVCGSFDFGICNKYIRVLDSEAVYSLEKEIERGKRKSVCCCENCKHLTRKGCTTKNLRCKLYLCWHLEKNEKELNNKLRDIENDCRKLGFDLQYFVSKEIIIRDTIRMIHKYENYNAEWQKLIEPLKCQT
jgi:hypothetical protein